MSIVHRAVFMAGFFLISWVNNISFKCPTYRALNVVMKRDVAAFERSAPFVEMTMIHLLAENMSIEKSARIVKNRKYMRLQDPTAVVRRDVFDEALMDDETIRRRKARPVSTSRRKLQQIEKAKLIRSQGMAIKWVVID